MRGARQGTSARLRRWGLVRVAAVSACRFHAAPSPHDLHAQQKCSVTHCGRVHESGPTDGVLDRQVHMLQSEISSLRAELAERDKIIADLRRTIAASAPSEVGTDSSWSQFPPPGACLVQTAAELAAAIEVHARLIAVPASSRIRVRDTVTISHSMTVIGEPTAKPEDRATIEATISVKGSSASLTCSDVNITGSLESEPVVAVQSSARLTLENCSLSNGRDGVYLASKASSTLVGCHIARCVRGVVELIRCQADVKGCRFSGIPFPCVLLSPPPSGTPREDRARDVAAANSFDECRCHVALAHNPIQDRYDELYRDGGFITLSDAESTANLVDAPW